MVLQNVIWSVWHLTSCKNSVGLAFLNWIKNKIILYHITELMLPTLIQRYDKNHFIFHPFQTCETNWIFTGRQMPQFMIVLIFLNLSWIIKCLFLRNMEPLTDSKNDCCSNNSFISSEVPQIVIMGPPASGKRTISKMVSNKLRTAHLTPDNLIQDADSDLKTEAQAFVKRNEVCEI